MTTNVRVHWPAGVYDYDTPVMTQEEFEAIMDQRDTPEMVKLTDGRVYYNDYTCYAGFDGTCNCGSHPMKSWRELAHMSADDYAWVIPETDE